VDKVEKPAGAGTGKVSPTLKPTPSPPAQAKPSGRTTATPTGGGKASAPAPAAGTLASRRGIQGKLQGVSTASKKDTPADGASRIKWCSKLSDRYVLGQEVMPSCHRGMQVLYGKSRANGTEVVIKVRAKKHSFKDNEEKEWRISTQFMLNLPRSGNIAQIYEVLEDVENYYVVMEKCPGQDLFESLHSQDKLSIEECKDVISQILTALADLHERGLVHKDLKLENVMLDRTPSTSKSISKVWGDPDSGSNSPLTVKLVDFDTVEEHIPQTPKKAKDVLGTDQYIAQEAYAGNYSPASDIFAVGVIAYRLLAGRFPFDPRMFNDQPGENWVGSPKMKEIREKLCRYKVNYDVRVFQKDQQACELVKSMLATRESDRPSAKEALNHMWFVTKSSPRSSTTSDRGKSFSRTELPSAVQETAKVC